MWVATAIVASTVIGAAASNSASKRASKAQQGASDAAAQQAQIAGEQWDKYLELYEPLEKKMVQKADQYDSPENYAKASGDAAATVSNEFTKARDTLGRTPGLDPSSGAFQAGMTNLGLGEAATSATQQNAARQKVTDTAWARNVDAMSLGKGLPAQASSGLASASSTLNGVAANQQNLASNQANAAGQFVSNLSSAWLKNNGTQAPAPVTSVTPTPVNNVGLDQITA